LLPTVKRKKLLRPVSSSVRVVEFCLKGKEKLWRDLSKRPKNDDVTKRRTGKD
jgi:hypothetical protein